MDDILIIVLLEPRKWSTDQSQVAESTHKTGHHNVPGRDVRKSQESCTVPVSVPSVNTPPRARG